MITNIKLRSCLLLTTLLLLATVVSCDKNDDDAKAQVVLNSFGPSVLRGGELKFIGNNLNKVTAIVLPDNVEIPASSFKTSTSTLITIDVPDEAVGGLITLKTSDGDIVTKTELSILEPITITSFEPEIIRPGDKLTIKGTYLNLITQVIFPSSLVVTDFESQSRTEIVVTVPMAAQTGKIAVSDGEETPNVVQSEAPLTVKLPMITEMSPSPIKPGAELTITGTDLDLTNSVEFGGQKSTSTFTKSATEITVNVPWDAQDGKVKLIPASLIKSESPADLILVAPVITSITGVSANTAKNNGTLTISGTNLDLVNSVLFGGKKSANPNSGGTANQITVTVPAAAKDSVLTFNTYNKPVVSADPLTLVVPTITSFTPSSVQTKDNPSITINGTDLDLVTKVVFTGDFESKVNGATAAQIVVPVAPGAKTGIFTLVTTNGSQVHSASNLTIVPDVPAISPMPATVYIGTTLTLTGTNMNVWTQIIFPGNKVATEFGMKTSTSIEVLVPKETSAGMGTIKFVTAKNEVYESPSANFRFPGTEPIADPSLVLLNFDEKLKDNHDLGWDNWAGNVELGSNASVGVDGKYMHGTNAAATGWTWIWGCNHDQLPKLAVTTADHYLKMDIKITKPIAAGVNFQMELGPGNYINLGNLGGTTPDNGWATITYDLSTFGGLPATTPATGEWGLILNSGTVDLTGLYIDNIRFQAK